MKLRADALLLEQGLAPTRSRAQALILAGKVFWGERRIDKVGTPLPKDATLSVRGEPTYVSRGGNKLEGALRDLAVDTRGVVAVDVGASTGGFTHCLLEHGAARVYAVDVGRGQLAERLRQDPRVVNMEGVNARHLEASSFPEPIQLVVVDASFIGIDKLIPAIASFTSSGARLLSLVKPQFEAGRAEASRGRGVIRDPAVREAAIAGARLAILDAGFELLGECESRLRGPKGNLEQFVLARRR